MIEEKYAKIADFCVNGIPAIKRTGIRMLEMRERYAKLLMPMEGNSNHVGIMYAGSIFSLGEITGGVIAGCSVDFTKYVPIVKDVSIRYRRPALTDVTVEVSMTAEDVKKIVAEAEEKGKADFPLSLEIKDMNNEVVSLVSGTWQIRKWPEGVEIPKL